VAVHRRRIAIGCIVAVATSGRREVLGISTGTRLVAQGMAGSHFGRLAILNPAYELVSEAEIHGT